MVPTIEVSEQTLRLLELLAEARSGSFDEVILDLYCKAEGVPRAAFARGTVVPEHPSKAAGAKQ